MCSSVARRFVRFATSLSERFLTFLSRFSTTVEWDERTWRTECKDDFVSSPSKTLRAVLSESVPNERYATGEERTEAESEGRREERSSRSTTLSSSSTLLLDEDDESSGGATDVDRSREEDDD